MKLKKLIALGVMVVTLVTPVSALAVTTNTVAEPLTQIDSIFGKSKEGNGTAFFADGSAAAPCGLRY
ncbi:hypothetical protein [Clostridium cibarium]|uniref:Uncharacterized protein n=1 Tax=Clostridium cibarium TaxID=2762247 RepID=A0ABR8PV55_9CLOT|nr:hypothetical protein [Clostridium cibarium]MBD7912048.1 hypothetical protein [Clostridium cibarium]